LFEAERRPVFRGAGETTAFGLVAGCSVGGLEMVVAGTCVFLVVAADAPAASRCLYFLRAYFFRKAAALAA